MRRSRIRGTSWFDLDLSLTQRREDAKVFLREAVDDTLDPILHQVGSEVEQIPKLQSLKLLLSEDLFCVHLD